MSREEKQLRQLLAEQQQHHKACQDALNQAAIAISETDSKLREIEREKKRSAKLTPAMLSALAALANDGAYLRRCQSFRGNDRFYLEPSEREVQRVNGSIFQGLLEREAIYCTKAANYATDGRYVITPHGRKLLETAQGTEGKAA